MMGLFGNARRSANGTWRRPDENSQLYKDVHDEIMREQMITQRVTPWPFVRLFVPIVICLGIWMIFDGRWDSVAPFASGLSTVTYFVWVVVFVLRAGADATERNVRKSPNDRPLVKAFICSVLFSLSLVTFVTFGLSYG